jgi:hypothetical protein
MPSPHIPIRGIAGNATNHQALEVYCIAAILFISSFFSLYLTGEELIIIKYVSIFPKSLLDIIGIKANYSEIDVKVR